MPTPTNATTVLLQKILMRDGNARARAGVDWRALSVPGAPTRNVKGDSGQGHRGHVRGGRSGADRGDLRRLVERPHVAAQRLGAFRRCREAAHTAGAEGRPVTLISAQNLQLPRRTSRWARQSI